MSDSSKSISPLRQRMIEDMTLRRLSPKTQSGYIRVIKNLTWFTTSYISPLIQFKLQFLLWLLLLLQAFQ